MPTAPATRRQKLMFHLACVLSVLVTEALTGGSPGGLIIGSRTAPNRATLLLRRCWALDYTFPGYPPSSVLALLNRRQPALQRQCRQHIQRPAPKGLAASS
jgi:hypothetical protein